MRLLVFWKIWLWPKKYTYRGEVCYTFGPLRWTNYGDGY